MNNNLSGGLILKMDDIIEATDHLVEDVEELSLQEQLDRMKDQWMRAVAETENLRKRSVREREDSLKYGIVQFARDMLSISDNLGRAMVNLKDMPVTDGLKKIIDGVDAIEKELEKTLERHGVKKLDALGVPFDPHTHQAVVEIESKDHEPGTVVSVFQDGYMIYERLLRPAMVSLSKKREDSVETPG